MVRTVTKPHLIRLHTMNKTIISFAIIAFFSIAIVAQNNQKTITGRVLDKENNKAISLASIYLKGQAIGTVSNEDGEFIFHVSDVDQSNIVVISCLGYQSIERKIDDFVTHQNIVLSAEISNLNEVVITATKKKQLTAKEIVKKAYKQIPNNYPNTPYILEGYIRDLQKEDDNYVEYLECAAKFLYQGYKTQREPQVELLEVKTNYLAEKHPWNAQWERKNSIMDLIEDDFIRFDYGPIKGKNGWKYDLESIVPYSNGLVYKITGVDKPFQNAVLFIDTETFAFVKIELTRKAKNKKSWRRRFTNGAHQMFYNLVLEYQEYNGKMFLKYQKEEDTWKIFKGLESNKLLFTQYPKKELFINNIIVDEVKNHPFTRNMDIGSSIENQAKDYNAAFWSSYNIPKQTEKESKIILELKNRIK
ncbi:carboxypeptidase-like regulatory domain-containing protein [Aquimarina sp. MMG016]|uniref:carboxypeptidase-like regulatory domain-containing protein n=1 Tax=Aquimarina sp. MMG016 TaxID=2822690 RepID=UPI001B3A6DC0|nr:carboxypeptidase-like regulatory domain-containing protein [Aquimarina sp. MMG016]MBQ4822117.1 carboxypeptidase-like regulatory domain-containing protein [Aquimarina sp. MMG016]